jgi:hypothetical protein
MTHVADWLKFDQARKALGPNLSARIRPPATASSPDSKFL